MTRLIGSQWCRLMPVSKLGLHRDNYRAETDGREEFDRTTHERDSDYTTLSWFWPGTIIDPRVSHAVNCDSQAIQASAVATASQMR